MENLIFVYVDGITTKGEWIDLDEVDTFDDIKEKLVEYGHIRRDSNGEPDYDGDLLVADTDGELASKFYTGCGSFNLEGYVEARDSGMEEDVLVAYMTLFDYWDLSNSQDYYIGHYETPADFAQQYYLAGAEWFQQIPDAEKNYFDFERYVERELLICSFCEHNGYYFHNR